jgi:glycosyltransferase 2 family protein
MNRWVKLGVSILITVAALWWTFRDTHWDEMLLSLRSANRLVILPYLVMLAVIHLARTLRWGNLLSGLERVRFKPLNEASAIGFMMLIILPFRLGEFARPFLIAQRTGIRRSPAMTSVVLERIVDGVAVALMLRGLMFFIAGDSDGIRRIRLGANLMFLVFFSGLLFLILARWQHDRVIGAMRATLGRVVPGITEKAVHVVDGFVGALRQLPDGRNLAWFFAWTVAYWTLNGFGMSLMANAFDCGGGTVAGCQPLHISVFEGFVVVCVLIVGMMIPAAPGSAGTFQAFILLALSVFVPLDVVNSSGVAFANVLWIVQMAQQILTGLVFMAVSKTSFADVAGKLSADPG